jgi:bacteriorhodopsin
MFYIVWALFGPARTSAGALGPAYKKEFTSSAALLSFLWFLYPIAWGLSDGGAAIHPDSEMIFYGILDVLAKPGFILFHLWSISKLDLTALQLQSGKFTDSAHGVTNFDREKHAQGTAAHHPSPAATGAKKGMFSRKGKYDATAQPVIAVDNEPLGANRLSQSTVAA